MATTQASIGYPLFLQVMARLLFASDGTIVFARDGTIVFASFKIVFASLFLQAMACLFLQASASFVFQAIHTDPYGSTLLYIALIH